MTVQWKSFGFGVATTLIVMAIIAYPYRDEIVWAWKNRKTLDKVGDVASALKGLIS